MSDGTGSTGGESATYSGLAIDISNFAGSISDEWCGLAKSLGVGLTLVRLSTEDNGNQRAIARQQIDTLARNEMPWQGWLWCYWDEDPVNLWALATEMLDLSWPMYFGSRIWFDAEDATDVPEETIDYLQAYADIVGTAGFTPGCYSRRKWWDDNVSTPMRLQRHLLRGFRFWACQWDGNASCDGIIPVGPWLTAAIKQTGEFELDPALGPHDVDWACGVD